MARKHRRRSAAASQPDVAARVEAQWARIPQISSCKGLCRTTCTRIDMSDYERDRIRDRHGIDIPPLGSEPVTAENLARDCPALTVLGRCGVYEDRPVICRLWGAARDMPCVYGCVPDSPPLDAITAREILAEVYHAGGLSPFGQAQLARSPWRSPPTGAQMRAALESDPQAVAAWRRKAAAGTEMDRARARHLPPG